MTEIPPVYKVREKPLIALKNKNQNQMKIMIVTEQPVFDNKRENPLLKDIINCKCNNKCYSEVFNNHIEGFKKCFSKFIEPVPLAFPVDYYGQDRTESILPKIRNTINYIKEIIRGKVTVYWTHYVKCIGSPNFKEAKKYHKDEIDINVCANKWIKKEIDVYKPDVIIAFGTYAAGYLINGAGTGTNSGIKIGEYNPSRALSNKIFVIPHPASYQNTQIGGRSPEKKQLLGA